MEWNGGILDGENRFQFKPSSMEWLWIFRNPRSLVLDGVILPQVELLCNLGVLLHLGLLFKEHLWPKDALLYAIP